MFGNSYHLEYSCTERSRRNFILKILVVSLLIVALFIPSSASAADKRVIIVYDNPVTDQQVRNLSDVYNATVMHRYDIIPGVAARMNENAIAQIESKTNVKAVYEDKQFDASLDDSVPQINASQTHSAGVDGSGVSVCVLDTGIDQSHSDINSPVAEYDFVNGDSDANDNNGHGTHVAGIVASTDSTYRGVAYGASLMDGKVLDSGGSGSSSDVIAGIDWCVNNNADVISMSFGSGSYSSTCDGDPVSEAANNASEQGVTVLAASGNDGYSNSIELPACASNVIAVGAVDKDDNHAYYSNGGSELDVVAPGSNITSTYNDGGFEIMSGTSMATPHASGTASLILETNSGLTPSEVRDILRNTSVDLGAEGFDNDFGYGRIDAYAAYQSAATYVPDDYAKIQWAIDNVTEGATIVVRDGTYYEYIKVDKNVTLVSENPLGAVIKGDSSVNGTISITADNATVDGFKMRDYYVEHGGDPVINVSGSYVTVKNMDLFTEEGAPFEIAGTTDGVTISGNTIIANVSTGHPSIMAGGDDLLIEGNTIDRSENCSGGIGGIGVSMNSGDTVTIQDNTISHAYDEGIWFVGSGNIYLTGNTVNSYDLGGNDVEAAVKIVDEPATFNGFTNPVKGKKDALESNSVDDIYLQWLDGDVWVDDDWSGSTYGDEVETDKYFGENAFATVQNGVENVSASYVVHVADGTYGEVTINKTMTLEGAQANVDPRHSQGGRTGSESVLDGQGLVSSVIYVNASDVVVNGFEVTGGTGDLIKQSDAYSGTVVKYNYIHDSGDEGAQLKQCTDCVLEYNYVYNSSQDGLNIADGSFNGSIRYNEINGSYSENAGIYSYSSTDIDVIGNLVYNVYNNDGVKVGDSGTGEWNTGGVVRDNTVYDAVEDGITIYASDVIVEYNEVYNCGSKNGAMFLYNATNAYVSCNKIHDNAAIGVLVENSKNVTLVNNGIYNNNDSDDTKYSGSAGVWTTGVLDEFKANYNNIYDNAEYGFYNANTSYTVNATNNWWGASDGPGGAGSGSGDNVSSNVDYDPYESSAIDTCGISPSNSAPTADFSWSPSSPEVGETVSFSDESTDSDGSVESWSWDFGDGNTSSQQNPSHSYSSSGDYSVMLTVTDDDGATDSQSYTVSVSTAGPSITSNWNNVTDDGSTSISVTVNSTVEFGVVADESIDSWNWSGVDSYTTDTTESNASKHYSSTGDYTVSVYGSNSNGDTETVSWSVSVTSPVPSDYVSYWKLDENSGDVAGDEATNNNGNIQGMPATKWTTGQHNYGVELGGSNDYVDINDDPSLNFDSNNFSITAWVKTNDNNQWQVIGNYPVTTTASSYWHIGVINNHLAVRLYDASDKAVKEGTKIVNDGAWHHLAFVRSGSTGYLYVDGSQETTVDLSAIGDIDSGHGLKFGAYYYKNFDGVVDDIRVYDRALASGEVIDVRDNAGTVTDYVSYWKLDENSGDVAGDEATNNNGNIQGMPATKWTTGQHNYGVELGGSNDYVDINDDPSLNFDSNNFSITAWVKTNDNNQWQVIGNYPVTTTASSYWHIGVINNHLAVRLYDASDKAVKEGTKIVNDGAWHHLAFVRSGSTGYLYVDGSQETTVDLSAIGDIDSGHGLKFGAYYYKNFDGVVDDIRVYDRALNSSEVTGVM